MASMQQLKTQASEIAQRSTDSDVKQIAAIVEELCSAVEHAERIARSASDAAQRAKRDTKH